MAELVVPTRQPTALGVVLDELPPELTAALSAPRIRIAVNGVVLGAEQSPWELTVTDGDEIAFLPPVSGG
ncbi:MAG: MoaD/ThiS family protein [Novosphingobium sp.]